MKTFDFSMHGRGNFAREPAGSGEADGGRVKGRSSRPKRWLLWVLIVLLVGMLVAFAMDGGRMLVVDDPKPSDVILVLAGETERRPERALQLLDQGYGRRIVMDVPAMARIYNSTQVELAEKYVRGLPQGALVQICPIEGLSTRDEVHDVEKCLAGEEARRVLIVTSDFHTRRALNIFREEVPGRSFSVAAAKDGTQFGTRWWTHRQWAKTCLDEWMKVVWWTTVDRWH